MNLRTTPCSVRRKPPPEKAGVGNKLQEMKGRMIRTSGGEMTSDGPDPFCAPKRVLKFSCIGVCFLALLIGIQCYHIIGFLGVAVETIFVSLIVTFWYIHGMTKIKQAETNYRITKEKIEANKALHGIVANRERRTEMTMPVEERDKETLAQWRKRKAQEDLKSGGERILKDFLPPNSSASSILKSAVILGVVGLLVDLNFADFRPTLSLAVLVSIPCLWWASKGLFCGLKSKNARIASRVALVFFEAVGTLVFIYWMKGGFDIGCIRP
jgi:hypothetical protein